MQKVGTEIKSLCVLRGQTHKIRIGGCKVNSTEQPDVSKGNLGDIKEKKELRQRNTNKNKTY